MPRRALRGYDTREKDCLQIMSPTVMIVPGGYRAGAGGRESRLVADRPFPEVSLKSRDDLARGLISDPQASRGSTGPPSGRSGADR